MPADREREREIVERLKPAHRRAAQVAAELAARKTWEEQAKERRKNVEAALHAHQARKLASYWLDTMVAVGAPGSRLLPYLQPVEYRGLFKTKTTLEREETAAWKVGTYTTSDGELEYYGGPGYYQHDVYLSVTGLLLEKNPDGTEARVAPATREVYIDEYRPNFEMPVRIETQPSEAFAMLYTHPKATKEILLPIAEQNGVAWTPPPTRILSEGFVSNFWG